MKSMEAMVLLCNTFAFPIPNPTNRAFAQPKPGKVHKGTLKKGPYLASCADFASRKDVLYDVDFLVHKGRNGRDHVVRALIHKKQGKKWHYQVQKK